MEVWTISFGEEIWPVFAAITRRYEGEDDEAFMSLARRRESAARQILPLSPTERCRYLAALRVLLDGGRWREVPWEQAESFPFSAEPEFLHELLQVIIEELEAALPPDPLPHPLTVHVTLGGGILSAPIEE